MDEKNRTIAILIWAILNNQFAKVNCAFLILPALVFMLAFMIERVRNRNIEGSLV